MKKLLFFSALAAMTLVACQSYDTELPMPDDEAALTAVQKEEITQITEDVNSGEVKNILGSLFGKQRKGRSADYTVSLLKDKQGVDRVICINYADNGGFALISAEKTHSPILAYADEGNFTVTDSLPFPLSEWMDCTMHSIAESESLPADSLATIARMWRKYDSGIMPLVDDYPPEHNKPANLTWDEYYALSKIMMKKIDEWNAAGHRVYAIDDWTGTCSLGDKNAVATYVQSHIYPYYMDDYWALTLVVEKDFDSNVGRGHCMTTKWSQTNGYNQSFAFNTATNTQYPTGCGVLAVGQIMYYFKHPDTYDWSQMTLSGYGNKITSDFLLDVKSKCQGTYIGNGTGTMHDNLALALRNEGYTCINSTSYTKNDIIYRGPSIFSGYFDKDMIHNGHTWIVEGGILGSYSSEVEVWSFDYSNEFVCFYNETTNQGNTEMYYINWCMENTNSNGYYTHLVSVPDQENFSYNTATKVIYNIQPPK